MEVGLQDLFQFLAGGGLAAVFTWMNTRARMRAYTMGIVDKSVQVAMESLQGTIKTLEVQHEQCKEDTKELRKQIDELMQGRVASYWEKPPND
jgi:hypothetical protein